MHPLTSRKSPKFAWWPSAKRRTRWLPASPAFFRMDFPCVESSPHPPNRKLPGPAEKITLGVTDVPVGRESALASGPTLPDPTTIADVAQILEQYGLRKRFPPALLRWLDAGNLPETPKAGHPAFRNAHFLLLL